MPSMSSWEQNWRTRRRQPIRTAMPTPIMLIPELCSAFRSCCHYVSSSWKLRPSLSIHLAALSNLGTVLRLALSSRLIS
jgi:hypothetical protein